MDHEDWREELKGFGPLRMSQVFTYLQSSGRTETCPFCAYTGAWDFHIQWDATTTAPENDPLMSVFELGSQLSSEPNECVAITCPQCAHFSLLDAGRIKTHILRLARLKEKTNG